MSNNTMKFLVTYIIVMIILQKVFTIPQTKRIAKKMKEIQKLGICSAGVGRNTFGLKIYYIIVADSQGNVIKGFKMGGITVLSNFSEDTKLTERTVSEIIENNTYKNTSLMQRAKVNAAKNLHQILEEKAYLAESHN